MSELKSGQSPAFRQRWNERGRTLTMTVGLSSAFLLVCAMGGIHLLKSAHIKAAMSQPARMPTLNTVGEPALVHASVSRKAELVFIPAGTVRIGDEDGPPSERPSFQYTSRPFLMDRTPVTVAQFAAFVEDTSYKTDAERYGSGGVMDEKQGAWIAAQGATWRRPLGPKEPAAHANHPVTQVSWYDANAFCRAYGMRLPKEFEWERAARMGQTPDGHVFKAGDPIELSHRYLLNAWEGTFPLLSTAADGYRTTSPVGAFGTAPSGLTDMAGNVWEWTSSWYVPYGAPDREPADGQGERVSRGGSFLCSPQFCQGYRASARNHTTPDTSLENIGFRCVADPEDITSLSGRVVQKNARSRSRQQRAVSTGRKCEMKTLRRATKVPVTVLSVAALTAAALGTGGYAWHAVRETNTVAAATRPNVIVILADDLGYADISAYKVDRFQTPNIDRIGMEGVRFTDGYASAPVCAPSRAGLMTGREQNRFGFEYNDGPAQRDLAEGLGLAVGETTIAQLLKDAGYHTGLIGKWHLGSQKQFYPMNRGFDEFVGFLPGETSYMDPKQPGVHLSYGPLGDDVLTHQQQPNVNDADLDRRINRIAGTFDRGPLNQIVEGPNQRVVHNEDEYLTDYFGDRAVDYIQRNAKAGKPYFLYLAFNAVHSPHMVTAKYYDRFPQIQNHEERVYAAMVAALDDNVGRVLAAVAAAGQTDNTIVYFASDNGCAAYWPGLCSCTPLRGGKLSYYEGGIRVPFMVRWPGHIKAGLVYRDVVSLLDVLPTSVAAAGGKLPTDRVYDGVDLMPYLTGKNTGPPHNMLAWRELPLFSIRQGDWKLWESVNDKTGKFGEYKLLFNLKDDLNESTNLADKDPQKVKELEDLSHQWSKMMTDPKWDTKRPTTYNVCGTPFTLPI